MKKPEWKYITGYAHVAPGEVLPSPKKFIEPTCQRGYDQDKGDYYEAGIAKNGRWIWVDSRNLKE